MKLVKRYQQGGSMEAAPMPEEQAPTQDQQSAGGDPLTQILEILGQLAEAGNAALQSNDPNALAQVVQGVVQFYSDLSAQMGGGGPQEAPVFKKGGKISKMKKMEKPMEKSYK